MTGIKFTHSLAVKEAILFTALGILFLAPVGISKAAVVATDLYLRSGSFRTIDDRVLPALCFSDQESGPVELNAPVLSLEAGDILSVTLHNQDSEAHGLEIVGVGGQLSSVSPGTSETFEFSFPEAGTWLFRDPVNYPLNVGLGLAGTVEVHDPSATHDAQFLWFLGEHSEDWMVNYDAGFQVDTSSYFPNYFTINGVSGADIGDDPRAHLVGRVGDELLIRVVNGGLRLHSIHFHGYHVQVVARNGASISAPRIKDTIAVPVGETAEFLLVPHQPGVFPIHDHVVLAVAGNGVYPNGMIVFTDIQP